MRSNLRHAAEQIAAGEQRGVPGHADRGFRHYPRTLDTFKMRMIDWLAGTLVVMVSAAAIWLGR